MNTYQIKIVALASTNPITKKFMPQQEEIVTVVAPNLRKARNLAPVYMNMTVLGQEVQFFHDGKLIESSR